MKKWIYISCFVLAVTGCSPKTGCPTNGKNIGAERILSGDKKAIKAAKKAKKFRPVR